jgi:hypothetical protein
MKDVVSLLLRVCLAGGTSGQVEGEAKGDVALTLEALRTGDVGATGALAGKHSKTDWEGMQGGINAGITQLQADQADKARACLAPYMPGIVQAMLLDVKLQSGVRSSGVNLGEMTPGRELLVTVTVPPSGLVHFGVGYLSDGQAVRICLPAQVDGVPSEGLFDFWLVPSDGFDFGSEPRVGEFRTINGVCMVETHSGLPRESIAIAGAKYSVAIRQSPNGLVGLFNRGFGFTGVYDRRFVLSIRRN